MLGFGRKTVASGFIVNIYRNGKRIKTENVDTLPELKSFLYGIRETVCMNDIVAMAHGTSPEYGMIVQEPGQSIRLPFGSLVMKDYRDEKFLKKFKKSAYA